MQKIIFFDTETTGNTEKDFLCQLAYKTQNESFCELYKPPIKIPPETSAIHHITNKILEDKPAFSESRDYIKIKTLFEDDNSVVVAHNAIFDLMIIKQEKIIPKNFICTLRLARFLDSEGKIGKYNLQYLRYLLEIDVEAEAHDAAGDVLVLEQLFERLKKKLIEIEKIDEASAINRMIEISSKPSIFKFIPFGKHNGKEITEIAKVDPGYLEWLLAQKLASDQIDEDWIYTLRHHLGKL